jgi:hypothetical protein
MLSRGKLIAAGATGAAVIAVAALVLLRPESPHPTAAQTTTPPPAGAPAATPQGTQSAITGIYQIHWLSPQWDCGRFGGSMAPDFSAGISQHGNTITFISATGPLNADGSFVATDSGSYGYTWRGVFATEGGRTVIRDGDATMKLPLSNCHNTFTATKQ